MDKKDRKLLLKNRLAFVKDLDASDITGLLFEAGIITENDKESIEAIKLRRERVELLLDLLPRKGPKAFDGFCKALEESGFYGHLLKELQSKGKSKDKGVSCKYTLGIHCTFATRKFQNDLLTFKQLFTVVYSYLHAHIIGWT